MAAARKLSEPVWSHSRTPRCSNREHSCVPEVPSCCEPAPGASGLMGCVNGDTTRPAMSGRPNRAPSLGERRSPWEGACPADGTLPLLAVCCGAGARQCHSCWVNQGVAGARGCPGLVTRTRSSAQLAALLGTSPCSQPVSGFCVVRTGNRSGCGASPFYAKPTQLTRTEREPPRVLPNPTVEKLSCLTANTKAPRVF